MNTESKNNVSGSNNKEEVSLKELILALRKQLLFLGKKWMVIGLAVLIGIGAGFVQSSSSKPIYTANCTFVLDLGSERGGLSGGLAALSGMTNASAGLFNESDNIIWLYSTKLMIQKTLLTPTMHNGKEELLINWFIQSSGIQKNLNKQKGLKNVHFLIGTDTGKLTIQQNSIIDICVDKVKTKHLKVSETDKTKNVITTSFSSDDELFAKAFTDALVKNVNSYYIKTKTQKTSNEVKILQDKVDSFRQQMNTSIYQAAAAVDAAPNANPSQLVLRVTPQKKQVDVQVSSTIYTELTKNLELQKLSLAKQTPLILVVEEPTLPLPYRQTGLVKATLLWCVGLAFLTIVILLGRNYYRELMK